MNRMAALAGVIPLMALVVWTPGCKSENDRKPPAEQDVAPVVETVDDDAVAILKGAVELLRATDSFHVVTESGFDVVQSDGQKIEFGATRRATIQRPNRARFETHRRDGKNVVVVFDGNDMWVYSPTHDVYARTSQPGGIGDSIELLTEELGINAPLSDLYTTDVGSTLAEGLRSCYVVGESTVGGQVCDHVAVRNDYADYQIWVEKGEQPLLRRIVITYREEPGEPQFWANFTEWNMAPAANSRTFVFQPPEGSEQIQFQSIRPPAEEE